MGGFLRRHKRIIPYLLLAPGLLWLAVFYVVPGFQMFVTSLWSGTLETGYEFALSNVSNYTAALARFAPQFIRSIIYGGAATILTFAISYPLAYTIAFRGGRYKNLLLFLVVAPFFTSFLLRTLSWKIILGDTGILLGPLKALGILPDEFRVLATPVAVIFGITYNFLPFMTLPIYVSLEKIDRRLVEAAEDLFATSIGAFRRITLPLSLPGAPDVHPGDGRLRQRRVARQPGYDDDRERHPESVPDPEQLPDGVGIELPVDGRHPRRGGHLCQAARDRRTDGRRRLMATIAVTARTRPSGTISERFVRFWNRYLLFIYTGFAVLYLMLPVAVMALFSFNDPAGKSNFVWQGFTLDAWQNIFEVAGLQSAVTISLGIAFVSTAVATALGTLIALALARHDFRGRSGTNLFIFLPMATPEIVLGASLLTLFVAIGAPPFFPLSFITILIAHIMFNISFVVVTVRARLAGFPTHLEEAAMDLGANELTTFRKVTFPLILPGIMAAALLAFSLSIDDFVITNFTSGGTVTFPMFIYAKARIGIPPQVNVVGTIIFLTAVGLVAFSTLLSRRRTMRDEAAARRFAADNT